MEIRLLLERGDNFLSYFELNVKIQINCRCRIRTTRLSEAFAKTFLSSCSTNGDTLLSSYEAFLFVIKL